MSGNEGAQMVTFRYAKDCPVHFAGLIDVVIHSKVVEVATGDTIYEADAYAPSPVGMNRCSSPPSALRDTTTASCRLQSRSSWTGPKAEKWPEARAVIEGQNTSIRRLDQCKPELALIFAVERYLAGLTGAARGPDEEVPRSRVRHIILRCKTAPGSRWAEKFLDFAEVQNWNGSTETEILPSGDCWTVKFTSFEALISPTAADIEPLHFNVRLSALDDVVTILSPRRYMGCWPSDFSASVVGAVEFLAAKAASAFLWSSETI
jgi:hypothetical protein